MSHVFVSYAHDDADFVKLMRQEFEDTDIELWIDDERLQVGDNWRNGIDRAIRDANALILVMSPTSFESKYVTYEWAFALGLNKAVIPILLKKTDLHPRLDILQYLDFTNHNFRPWDKLKDAVLHPERISLSATVRTLDTSLLPVIEDLQHEKSEKRRNAARLLGQIGDQSVLPDLIKKLDDENWSVREIVAEALGRIGDASVVTPLLRRFHNDKSLNVRMTIAWSLGELRADRSIQSLTEAVEKARREEWKLKYVCLNALGKIHTPDAWDSLIKIITSKYFFDNDAKQRAIEVIISTGNKDIISKLTILKNEPLFEFVMNSLESMDLSDFIEVGD